MSEAERGLVRETRSAEAAPAHLSMDIRASIRSLNDPIGSALSRLRPPVARRRVGAFYTPAPIVQPMLDWMFTRRPDRLVDAGCGSGRFVAAAVSRQPSLPVVAVDLDPMATLITRATLAVLGAERATVLQADYTRLRLPPMQGRTGYIGNPPYVRHHDLSVDAKAWASEAAKRLGHRASGLAGLHSHFFLATALHARPGDIGCFVTSAEWLNVNYGSLVRELFVDGLGGTHLHVIEPRALPFDEAMTTAAIVCFEVGSAGQDVRVHLAGSAEELHGLEHGHFVRREALAESARWTPFLVDADVPEVPALTSTLTLGSIVSVHRGVVTGANDYFVLTRDRARSLSLEQWCRPAITAGDEILRAGGVVRDTSARKLLLDIPADINRSRFPALDAYLCLGERSNGDQPPIADRYIPRHRRPWWSLGIKAPPPIVASYMARQPPAFALNPDGLALINIGHGLHPRDDATPEQLSSLVSALNQERDHFRGRGRTYQGGLEKFEPREMEALPVPAGGWPS